VATTGPRLFDADEYTVGSDGSVFVAIGGSEPNLALPGMNGVALTAPVVGITLGTAATNARAYWLAAADGGVFSFGDAPFYGSMAATHLNAPIVAIAATPDAHGYWLAAADGGVFSFGDAPFYGSTATTHLNGPVVSMAVPDGGHGYWLAAADGGVFSFGSAPFKFSFVSGWPFQSTTAAIAAVPGHTLVTMAGATRPYVLFARNGNEAS
jgi:hypothetical protein